MQSIKANSQITFTMEDQLNPYPGIEKVRCLRNTDSGKIYQVTVVYSYEPELITTYYSNKKSEKFDTLYINDQLICH